MSVVREGHEYRLIEVFEGSRNASHKIFSPQIFPGVLRSKIHISNYLFILHTVSIYVHVHVLVH